MTDASAYEAIVEALLADPTITQGRMFGAPGLKVRGKVFAMLTQGSLVVKLPAPRAKALVASGAGTFFDPGHGRVMKEWISVPRDRAGTWLRLSVEARDYVARSVGS